MTLRESRLWEQWPQLCLFLMQKQIDMTLRESRQVGTMATALSIAYVETD